MKKLKRNFFSNCEKCNILSWLLLTYSACLLGVCPYVSNVRSIDLLEGPIRFGSWGFLEVYWYPLNNASQM